MKAPRWILPGPAGLTLVEIAIVVAVLVILFALGLPILQRAVDDAENAHAIGDIKAIEKDILMFELRNGYLPSSLLELGKGELLDPWGNPYVYLNFNVGMVSLALSGSGGGPSGQTFSQTSTSKSTQSPGGASTSSVTGAARKDRNLVPINSRFDLYSKGEDGESLPALTAPVSRDDIIRASDGSFVGLAEQY